MKYRDIIQFESLNEVVKFNRLNDEDYRKNTVSSYVFSDTYEKTIIPAICKNLDYTAGYETFGLQIVGTYGTGKSHLMSLFSLIAENAEYLPLVKNEKAAKVLGVIAGKYKIVRFELGSADELWNLVCHQIDLKFKDWDIDYSIAADNKQDMYKDKLNRMMAKFEEVFPDRGLMIVIDEMLSYLKGRSGSANLNRDLAVIQALGELCDHSKFRMVFGVQELIYSSPEFQFAAKMLNQVSQRYRQIEITKQDVQYVTEQRILKKTPEQKDTIRKHLTKFTEFFTDMHANLDEYVNLFPVNPSFFDNFQQIKIGKSQREILKTLSSKFEKIADDEVPETEPGLICYDSYWDDLQSSQMQTYPDIRRITEIMETVHQKISDNFTGARAKKIPLAHRIANACAVKILQDSLEKTSGANAISLVDDLCYFDKSCFDRDLLIDTVNTTANQIIQATDGQYFTMNAANQEYHIRVEGGVNYEQKIKAFVSTMSEDNKDSHFFNFLVEYLPISTDQYRREFKIFPQRVDWASHKIQLDGYIFMGNPAERCTTHPEQNFYIYFMPIFNRANMKHGDEADSVYIHLESVSDEMKELIELYAASEALIASSDSSQKRFYENYKNKYVDALKPVFQRDFLQCTEVVYMGEKQTITPEMMRSGSKEQVILNIASTVLEDYFCQQMPDYPKFTLLTSVMTNTNRDAMLKSARNKIANPSMGSRDGDSILAGLGLLQDNRLSTSTSIYALSIKEKLENKGEGQVLNRDEIFHRFYKEWENDWRSNDYNLESDLEFLVLSTMVAMGEIELNYPNGININAANIKQIVDMPKEGTFSFSHIRHPKGMNLAAVKELFIGITGKDMTSQLQNPEVYQQLVAQAKALAAKAVTSCNTLRNGLSLENIQIIGEAEASHMKSQLTALTGLCDKVANYASAAKIRNIPAEWTAEGLKHTFASKAFIDTINKGDKLVKEFIPRIDYLNQALQYMTDDAIKAAVTNALDKIDSIEINNDSKIEVFRKELDMLKEQYIAWYIDVYKEFHITGLQDTEKRKTMNSNTKKVCDAVCGSDHDNGYISVAHKYAEWTRKMAQLTTGTEPTVQSMLSSPYAGFNPTQYVGKKLPDLKDLNEELDSIFNDVDDALQLILSDQQLQTNRDILDDSQKGLLDRYITKSEELSPNNAERLYDIVRKLHEGIQRITISADDIRSQFNRPMTPDEAIKTFRNYINSLTASGKGDNIRIILN